MIGVGKAFHGMLIGGLLALILLSGCGSGGGGGGSDNPGDTTAPTVSSTSPANGSADIAMNSSIAATFSEGMDSSTINGTTFTLSGGSGSVSGTVTCNGSTATFTPSSNLSYNTTYTATITTGAKDAAGNAVAANYTWNFTTGNASDTTPPTVSSTNPANNATGVAVNSAITATFSETMDASSITTATFYVGGVSGSVTYTGTTATFTPPSSLAYSTTYTATITAGVKDSAGNAMASNYTWAFTTGSAPDTTPPTVLSTSPSNGAIGVEANTAITASFSEIMTASTISTATFTLSDGINYRAGTVTYTGTTATFTPSSNLTYSTTYTVTITTGVKDAAGNAMANNYTWNFTPGTSGTLDTTFGTGGKVTTAIGGSGDYANALGVQSDGKIVVAGCSYNSSNSDFALLRYNTNGTLDSTFGTDGKVITVIFGGGSNDLAYALGIQSDGKIVAAGSSYSGSDYDFALVRYNIDGTLDTSFGTSGMVTTAIGNSSDSASALGIQSDGKIVASGDTNNGNDYDFAIVRYNIDGTLDSTFGTGGKVTIAIGGSHDNARAFGIQSDGKIVVAGDSYTGSNSDFAILRLNTDGTLDTSFGTSGIVTTAIGGNSDYARALGIQSDGKIVVAGISLGTSVWTNFALVRYNIDGTLDSTFGTGGKVTTAIGTGSSASALYIQPDGKIVVAGTSISSKYDFAVVRYNTDGTLDTSFGTSGIVTTAIGSSSDDARALGIQSDGKIVAAGYSNNGSDYDFAVVRYLP